MARPSRTGSASTLDISASSGSSSITVPGDCNLVVAFWSHWDGSSSTMGTLSIDSDSFLPAVLETADGTWEADSNASGIGVAILENPSTGSQSVSWAWSTGGAREEGGALVLVYIKDANIGDAVRHSALDAESGATVPSAVVTTDETDLFLAYRANNGGETQGGLLFGGNAPGTTFVDDFVANGHIVDVGETTSPPTGTITVTASLPAFAAVIGISLKASEDSGTDIIESGAQSEAVAESSAGTLVAGVSAGQVLTGVGAEALAEATAGALVATSPAIRVDDVLVDTDSGEPIDLEAVELVVLGGTPGSRTIVTQSAAGEVDEGVIEIPGAYSLAAEYLVATIEGGTRMSILPATVIDRNA